jgi:hypothetical protein
MAGRHMGKMPMLRLLRLRLPWFQITSVRDWNSQDHELILAARDNDRLLGMGEIRAADVETVRTGRHVAEDEAALPVRPTVGFQQFPIAVDLAVRALDRPA